MIALPTPSAAAISAGVSVQALAAAGKWDEARHAGARFHARFPQSLLAPAVQAALQTIPELDPAAPGQ